MNEQIRLQRHDALIVVDVQKDFLPGGSLAVPDGNAVIVVLNTYISLFVKENLPIFLTRDWHPAGHCSFQESGGPWPAHCVQGSWGAGFPEALELPVAGQIISKAVNKDADAYSAFEKTELRVLLQQQRVKRLFIGGLATDYCVLNTVKDALAHDYRVLVLADAIRAVNVKPDDGDRAISEMQELGAVFIKFTDIEI